MLNVVSVTDSVSDVLLARTHRSTNINTQKKKEEKNLKKIFITRKKEEIKTYFLYFTEKKNYKNNINKITNKYFKKLEKFFLQRKQKFIIDFKIIIKLDKNINEKKLKIIL